MLTPLLWDQNNLEQQILTFICDKYTNLSALYRLHQYICDKRMPALIDEAFFRIFLFLKPSKPLLVVYTTTHQAKERGALKEPLKKSHEK